MGASKESVTGRHCLLGETLTSVLHGCTRLGESRTRRAVVGSPPGVVIRSVAVGGICEGWWYCARTGGL